MQATGELKNNKIIITDTKEIGRFNNKSHLGKTTKENQLELNLLEAIFLQGEKKLTIYQNKKEINFKEILTRAAKEISNLEIKYTIFKDLRKRGHAVKTFEEKNKFDFYIYKKNTEEKPNYISIFYERENINISKIKDLIKTANNKKGTLWFAIVDEEGDITYYDVGNINLIGKTKSQKIHKTTALLLKNQVIIFDKKTSEDLFKKEFYGKPFGEATQLSMVEALYLMEKKVIQLINIKNQKISEEEFIKIIKKSQPDIEKILTVFNDLKKRGLIVKTGFKFGTNFRAYSKNPEETHAEYLIHVVNKQFKVLWAEISRAVRLAHSVNKELIFAETDNKKIEYIKFGRLRP